MKKFVAIVLTLCMAFALCACGQQTPETQATEQAPERQTISYDINTGSIIPYTDTRIIQIGHVNPGTDEDFLTKFCHELSDELMKLSDGRYALEVMSDSSLGSETVMLEGLAMGTIEAACITNMTLSSSIGISNFIELPFVFSDINTAADFISDTEIMQPIYNAIEQQFGIHCNTYVFNGFRKTMSAEAPITNIDDFSGVKIRVPESTIFNETFRNLGANPTALAFSECFTALQQGTVDAMELPVASIFSTNLDSVAPYISATNHVFTSAGVMFSNSLWSSLSPEDQDIFHQALETAEASSRKYAIEYEKSMIDQMVARGATYVDEVDRPAFQEAVKPVYDMYAEIIGEDYYAQATEWLATHK